MSFFVTVGSAVLLTLARALDRLVGANSEAFDELAFNFDAACLFGRPFLTFYNKNQISLLQLVNDLKIKRSDPIQDVMQDLEKTIVNAIGVS